MSSEQHVIIPAGMQFYLAEGVNRVAVGHIDTMVSEKNVTKGMTWKEIAALNEARLSIMKLKAEFWSLLMALWEQSWGVALAERADEFSEVAMSNYGNDRSLQAVWEAGYLTRQYTLSSLEGTLNLIVGFDFDEEYENYLSFYYEETNGDCQRSNGLTLSNGWQAEVVYDERVTRKESLAGKTVVEVSSLQALACEAIQALA